MKKAFIASSLAAVVASAAIAAPVGYEDRPGFWLGNLNVSPFAEFSVLDDSNPNSVRKYTEELLNENGRKVESSTTFNYRAGVGLLLPANGWKLDGRLIYDGETYSEDDTDDRNNISEYLRISGRTAKGNTWSLYEQFSDIRYEDGFEVSQNDRKELSFGGSLGLILTDKSSLELGASYIDRTYDDVTCVDHSTLAFNIGLANRLTAKTDWTLSAGYEIDEKDDTDSEATGIKLLVGLRSRQTEKLTFNAAVGAELYEDFEHAIYDVNGAKTVLPSDDEVGFTYNLAAHWQYSRRLSFNISGNGEYEPAEDVNENSVYSTSIALTAAYRIGDKWEVRAGASYQRDDYTRDVEEKTDAYGNPYTSVEDGENRTDDEIATFARVSYALLKNCSVFVDWRYTDISSSVEGYDYDRERIGAGIALKY